VFVSPAHILALLAIGRQQFLRKIWNCNIVKFLEAGWVGAEVPVGLKLNYELWAEAQLRTFGLKPNYELWAKAQLRTLG
jgi:hypothetical protein